MTAAPHVVILCSRLDSPGGIERAIVNTANLFAQHGLSVSVLVLDEANGCFYPLSENVQTHRLPMTFGIQKEGNSLTKKLRLLRDVRSLRSELNKRRPDLVIATEYPFAVAAVKGGTMRDRKVISWEHRHYGAVGRSAFWRGIFRWTYKQLDAVVCLNKDEAALFTKHNRRVVVIPNFCTPQFSSQTVERKKRLLTIGHLSLTKGIDRLLPIAKTVLENHPGWQWKIIGEGELAETVLAFIQSQKLEGRLVLQAPESPQLANEYKEASLYVMTSRNECFPMTLLEAMQEGLPCVAFDCETGPRAIIANGLTGVLVEDGNQQAMIDALDRLMNDSSLRNEFSAATSYVPDLFSPENVWQQWSAFISAL